MLRVFLALGKIGERESVVWTEGSYSLVTSKKCLLQFEFTEA